MDKLIAIIYSSPHRNIPTTLVCYVEAMLEVAGTLRLCGTL